MRPWLVTDKHARRPRPHTAVAGAVREVITFRDPLTPVPLGEALARAFLGNPSFVVIAPDGTRTDGDAPPVRLPEETLRRLHAAVAPTAAPAADAATDTPGTRAAPAALPPGVVIARVTDLDRRGAIRLANILAGEARLGPQATRAEAEAFLTEITAVEPVVIAEALAGLEADRVGDA
ncbi:hypothetical protein [Roseospira visakhapatnamensis]|uniref:Uncharacterized protein n=1 Tax=Roseospira visakhapatnamensis TaxID=390880 RepID=A0A7W6RD69_9PROT|nr:hypothetical protein [Roseospira visakhapatnamensis]MBB4266303.1 hypothetical protein [Roseospira visakhapatnamensis]